MTDPPRPPREPTRWVAGLVDALRRWPLLLVGLAVIAWAVLRTPDGDPDTSKALTIIGAVLLGAGLVWVVLDRQDRPGDDDEPRDTR